MSLNPIPMKVVQSMDEVMSFKQHRDFACYDGGMEISYTPFPAQAVNNSNVQITCNPPDERTVVDPNISVDVEYQLDFTGVGPGGVDPLLVIGQYDGPRSFPLANTTSTVDFKVNGTSFNTNLNEYFSTINRTGMYSRDLNQEYSKTPSMLDQSQEYSDLVGSVRNPLNVYASSSPYVQARNAGYSTTDSSAMVYVPINTHTQARVFLSVNEPLFLSPFYPSKSGFSGISTMTGTFTFTDLRRVWSHGDSVNSGTIATLTVRILSMQLNFRYITPKDLNVIPRQMCWPYHEFLVVATTIQPAIPPNTSATISLTANNLNAHPNRLLFVVREQDTDLLSGVDCFKKTDTYARINTITVNYGNNQGKLSSATTNDLYDMYVRNSNGSLSFVEWTQTVGSVLPIDVGRDIGLDNLTCPSKLGNPLLSAKLNITNINQSRSIVFTVFCFVIYEGTACCNYGSFSKNIAVLNSEDVIKSQSPDSKTIVAHEPSNFYGGSFWSNLRSALVKGHDYAKKNKILSKSLNYLPDPRAKVASKVAKALGYGMNAGSVITMPQYYEDLEELPYSRGGRRKCKKRCVKKEVTRKTLKRRGGSLKTPKDKNYSDSDSDSEQDQNQNQDQGQDQYQNQE